MSILNDLTRFLETQLEEFLKNNPGLELQILLEELQQQERDTIKTIAALQLKEKSLQQQILTLAQDIQTWHSRIAKAKAAGADDLVQPAEERKASLLFQGNQLWQQMQTTKERLTQSQELLKKTQDKLKELKVKINQVKNSTTQSTSSYKTSNYTTNSKFDDPLEESFKRWELDQEIEELKRNLKQR